MREELPKDIHKELKDLIEKTAKALPCAKDVAAFLIAGHADKIGDDVLGIGQQ